MTMSLSVARGMGQGQGHLNITVPVSSDDGAGAGTMSFYQILSSATQWSRGEPRGLDTRCLVPGTLTLTAGGSGLSTQYNDNVPVSSKRDGTGTGTSQNHSPCL